MAGLWISGAGGVVNQGNSVETINTNAVLTADQTWQCCGTYHLSTTTSFLWDYGSISTNGHNLTIVAESTGGGGGADFQKYQRHGFGCDW